MSKFIRIFCRNAGRHFEVEGGTTLLELSKIPELNLGFSPICALVNNKTEHLGFPIFAPKDIEFIDASTPPGQHVYIRSLCMMAYCAVVATDESLNFRIEHSISRGYFCRLFNASGEQVEPSAELVDTILAEMRRLSEADIPLRHHEERTSEVMRIFQSQHLDQRVELIETIPDFYTPYYTLKGVADSYSGPLAPSTGLITVFNLVKWNDGMLLLGPDAENSAMPATPVVQQKMFKAFTDNLKFNYIVGIDNVGKLNKAIDKGESGRLINVAEALHDKKISRISDEILERHNVGNAKIILIAGPSSSGKTTTSKRLAIQLMTNLIVPKVISLDDYFVDREKTPRDASGDYDYENLHALDLYRFNSDLNKLIAGETVNIPTYSFEFGKRIERERPMRLGKNDVLIIEGIHGLNPELTSGVDSDSLFKIYVSALTTLHIDAHNWISTSDNRLLRRIIRDFKYRHTSPAETIRRWPSVRAGEEKWIFPFQENADATFNSSLLFELAVMKPFLLPLLENVPHTSPEYTMAYRLMRFLKIFRAVPAEQVPSTSLLREFLGGSSFKY
ncbi:MAG: nucleoside kinase [Candidatus Amulumruptor caecigallinarius]|nr:nucleoside kinase [Candidatus Amulumruptor caecigallinarius]